MFIFDAHKYSYLNPVALDWLLLPCMFQYCLHHCGWSSKVYYRDRVLFLGVCICTAIVKDDPNNRDDCIPTSILHSKERTERQYISIYFNGSRFYCKVNITCTRSCQCSSVVRPTADFSCQNAGRMISVAESTESIATEYCDGSGITELLFLWKIKNKKMKIKKWKW